LIEEFLAICRREIEKKSDADDVIAILRIVAKTIEDNPETVVRDQGWRVEPGGRGSCFCP
jgi:hypothetical protein